MGGERYREKCITGWMEERERERWRDREREREREIDKDLNCRGITRNVAEGRERNNEDDHARGQ